MFDIKIQKDKIEPEKIQKSVLHERAGAIDLFLGTVRNHTEGKSVRYLEFESYQPMAIKELHRIADVAKKTWPSIEKIAITHRLGQLKIGEIAVAIAVSSPHRDTAFTACRFVIDELKKSVPIWKKEFFEDGAVWVNARP